MKTKLLMLLALVGFTVHSHAEEWSKTEHDKAKTNYVELLPESKHRDYGWDVYTGSGFKWDPLWRNSEGHQDFTSGSIPVEKHGHGLITAVEWDNASNAYNTINGNKYLISWVWSNGEAYNHDAKVADTKYEYEGYARLLSRCFNESNGTDGDYVRAYWSSSTYSGGWYYSEYVPSSASKVTDSNKSYYDTDANHITVAGAWDITDTPYRADLFKAVDNAYIVRDDYQGNILKLHPAEYPSRKINALIPVAIKAFKNEDNTLTNEGYLAAANHLNSRVALLQNYETNKADYVDAVNDFQSFRTNPSFMYTLADGESLVVDLILGTHHYLDSLLKASEYGHNYFFAHSKKLVNKEEILLGDNAKAKQIANKVTAKAQAYYEKYVKDNTFKNAATKTKSGQEVISYVTADACKLYTAQSKAAADAALKTYKAAIDAVDTADVISEADAKAAATAYVDAMQSAMTLYSAEVNAMAVIDSVATYMNDSIQTSDNFITLRQSLEKAQSLVKNATSVDVVNSAMANLMSDLKTYSGETSTWTAEAWQKAQSNYKVLQKTVQSNMDVTNKMKGRTWDEAWRNSSMNHQHLNSDGVETEGHGSFIATEWDNANNLYNTVVGNKYLISWNWSDGHVYNHDAKTANGKFEYEGYARLLSRYFNNMSGDKYYCAYWAYNTNPGTDQAYNYTEFPAANAGKVPGSQKSYIGTTDAHLTVAGAWDVTGTPSRATLFHQIDTAYTMRDQLNAAGDAVIYPADGYAYKTMTAEINTAIKAFKQEGKDDAFYATAAKALQSRMALLVKYDADKALYAADTTAAKKSAKKEATYTLADGKTTKAGNLIPGVAEFVDSIYATSAYGDTITFAQSREMVNATNTKKAEQVASLTTANAVDYYATIKDKSAFKKTVKSGVKAADGKTPVTKAGCDTIPYLSEAAYKAYISKSHVVALKAKADYKKAIDANNAATVIDTVAAKKAADDYVDAIQRAEVLYSAEVNAMKVFDIISTFLNDTCQSVDSYKAVKEDLTIAEAAVVEAETKEAVDNAVAVLWSAYLLDNGETSTWTAEAWQNAQTNYQVLQKTTKANFNNAANFTWDNRWRNTSAGNQYLTNGAETEGHGSIVATEWDNANNLYNTTNGKQYLISWNWSNGKAYNHNAITNNGKYEYEGYARLLSRYFNDCKTTKYDSVYWAAGTDSKGWNYVEKTTAGSKQVVGSQRSYEGNNAQKLTVAAAWDITNTPSRATLFHQIDTAYTLRDSIKAGSTVRMYPADGYAYKTMTAEINTAIKAFDQDGKDDTFYATAAKALQSRMALLVNWDANKALYAADSTGYIKKNTTEKSYVIADGTSQPGNIIPSVSSFISALYYGSQYGDTLSFAHSREMINATNTAKAVDVAKNTTATAVKYHAAIKDGSAFKRSVKSGIKGNDGITKTLAGRDTIAWLKPATVAAYTNLSKGIGSNAYAVYTKAIDAIYSAAVIDTVAAKAAADTYVSEIQRASLLYSAEVNILEAIDSITTFVNDKCNSSEIYDALKASLERAQNDLVTAETPEAVEKIYQTLWSEFLLNNGVKTEWNKVMHDYCQVYYSVLQPKTQHLNYTKYVNWYWDNAWRNYNGKQGMTNGLELGGHGSIVATEWDNNEGLYNTANGHKYLISWVWGQSNNTAYNHNALVQNTNEAKLYEYEGYARLLSRMFNESYNSVGDFVNVSWANGKAYSEYPAEGAKAIAGSQRSFETDINENYRMTVAGAWDVTDTPNRDSLFHVIDQAFDTRDAYTGTTSDPVFTYPASCNAHKQMDKEIKKAIEIFKKDGLSDDDYKVAAIALKNRMGLLAKWHADSVLYAIDSTGYVKKYNNATKKYKIATGEQFIANHVPGIPEFIDSLYTTSAYGDTLSFAHSIEMLNATNAAKADTIAKLTTSGAWQFYYNRVTGNTWFVASKNLLGLEVIPRPSKETYKTYTSKSKGLGIAAKDAYKKAIDAIYAAAVIDTVAAKKAADTYADAMQRAGVLLSAECNAMYEFEKIALFLNDTCQSVSSYNAIKEALTTAQAAVTEAETKEAVDNAVATLITVYNTESGKNTEWTKVTYDKAQVYYSVVQPKTQHLNYVKYNNNKWYWDYAWRNNLAQGTSYWDLEPNGHGSIVATEWDNAEGHYNTANGHKYLISWVWSDGQNKNYDFGKEVSDLTTGAKKFEYEGYARLLSRMFNDGTAETAAFANAYWANGKMYSEYTTVDPYSKRIENSQRSFEGTGQHITVAGAWDITDTPNRDSLFHEIDMAFDTRDAYTGTNSAPVFTYPADCYAHKQMDVVIKEAVTSFNKDGQTDDFYKNAALALKNRMGLLAKWHADSILYTKDSTMYVQNNTVKSYVIADGTERVGNVIPGVSDFINSLYSTSAYGDTLSFAHSREMINATNTAKAAVVAKKTTANAVKYFAAINDGSAYKRAVKSGIVGNDGINKTLAGRDTIATLKPETYKAYTAMSKEISSTAFATYKKAIDAIYTASIIDTVAAKTAADSYTDEMQRAAILYSAEINILQAFDSITTFVNDKCNSSEIYDALKASLVRAQNDLVVAQTPEAVEKIYQTLWSEFILYNGVKTEWNKVMHDYCQVYYSVLQPKTQHLNYTKYVNWYWDNAWRNYNGKQGMTKGLELGGHGSIVATEWDNNEGLYNTANGHKYLISWVWGQSNNTAYDHTALVKNTKEAQLYEYEGYARLLSRMFNESYNSVGDFVNVSWANGKAYSEYPAEGAKAIAGSQRSFETDTNENYHMTVAGAWDVTDTPNRDSLFHVIDQAFDTRDAWTGSYTAPVFTYPASCNAHKQMDKEIKKAIEVFKKDGLSDDDYKVAAIALKDRMNLLVQWHNDSITYDEQSKTIAAAYYNTYTNHEPGTGLLAKAILDVKAYNHTYAFKHSFQLFKDEPAAITKVNALTTARAKKFYSEQILTGNIYKKYYNHPTRVLNGTVAGFDTIPYLKVEAYNTYKTKSEGIVNAATDQYKTAIDAVYAAPAIDIAAADSAAAKFVDIAERAGVLFSAEVNAMSVLDEVATFVNDSCINFGEYDNIKAEYNRTMKTIAEAETKEAIDNQIAILYNVLTKARINNKVEVVKDSLIDIYDIAESVFNKEMLKKTPIMQFDYQSTANLHNALSAANKILLNTPTDNRSIELTFNGKWDLYDNSWQAGVRDWKEETPVSRVVREDSTLNHELELYKAQYELETILDSLTYKYNTGKVASTLFAFPAAIIKKAIEHGNMINNAVTALTDKTNLEPTPIEAVKKCVKETLEANDRANYWQKEISDTIAYAEFVIDSLNYRDTKDTLALYLERFINNMLQYDAFYAMTESEGVTEVNSQMAYLVNIENIQKVLDIDPTYLYYVINADVKDDQKALKWWDKHQDELSEYQRNIFLTALNMAQVVWKEHMSAVQNTYQEGPSHERYYFSIWAVELAMDMIPNKAIPDPYPATSEEDRNQLGQSLLSVLNYLNARTYYVDQTIEYDPYAASVLQEAIRVYNESYATSDAYSTAKAKVDALLSTEKTGISTVKSETEAADGKYIQNGKIVIVKGGKQYNAAGAMTK